MYDEFGNLKKKFRAKTQQAEAGQVLPGSGRAGWEVEELGTVSSVFLRNLQVHFCFFFSCPFTSHVGYYLQGQDMVLGP